MQEHNLNFVVGRNSILSLLHSKSKVIKVRIDVNASSDGKIREIIDLCKTRGVVVEFVSRSKLTGKENQGVDASFVVPYPKNIEDVVLDNPFFVIFRELLYKQNLGAIMRSCDIAGVGSIILPKKNQDMLGSTEVSRISEGASFNVNTVSANIFESIDLLKKYGVKVFGIEVSGDKRYFDEDLKGPVAFLFGGEDAALSEPLIARCDKILSIPQSSQSFVNSLNVSSAVSIVIFEKIRQESL